MWRRSGGCGTLHTVSNFTMIQLIHVKEERSEKHSAHYTNSQQLGSPGFNIPQRGLGSTDDG